MQDQKWDKIIKPKRNLIEIDFTNLWVYRDLLRILTFRELLKYILSMDD
tara:strand:+ start:132 stop:278 length:147 start_codon:yes stop_codon:yes gene_type:complete